MALVTYRRGPCRARPGDQTPSATGADLPAAGRSVGPCGTCGNQRHGAGRPEGRLGISRRPRVARARRLCRDRRVAERPAARPGRCGCTDGGAARTLRAMPRLTILAIRPAPEDSIGPSGIHLRWMVPPELGFPVDGVRVYRRPSNPPQLDCTRFDALKKGEPLPVGARPGHAEWFVHESVRLQGSGPGRCAWKRPPPWDRPRRCDGRSTGRSWQCRSDTPTRSPVRRSCSRRLTRTGAFLQPRLDPAHPERSETAKWTWSGDHDRDAPARDARARRAVRHYRGRAVSRGLGPPDRGVAVAGAAVGRPGPGPAHVAVGRGRSQSCRGGPGRGRGGLRAAACRDAAMASGAGRGRSGPTGKSGRSAAGASGSAAAGDDAATHRDPTPGDAAARCARPQRRAPAQPRLGGSRPRP